MTSRGSAIDSKLVLYRDHLDVIDVHVISRAPIRIEFSLVKLEMNPSRIIVALWSIVNRAHEAVALRKLRGDCLANIRGKSGDATLSRHVVAEEGNPSDVQCGH